MRIFKPKNYSVRSRRNGASLIEALIALSIVALVSMAIYGIQKDIITFNRFVQGGLSRENDIRKFLKDFSLAAREASQSSAGGYLIEEASDASFTFYADTDGDGKKERIRYFLSGSTLKRGVTVPAGLPFAYNLESETVVPAVNDIVSAPTIFYYYDSSYVGPSSSPLAQPVAVASVKMVKILFSVDPNLDKPPGPSIFSVMATIRNLRNL